jgi:hypothetical protein
MQKRGRKSAASLETTVIEGFFGQRVPPPEGMTERRGGDLAGDRGE